MKDFFQFLWNFFSILLCDEIDEMTYLLNKYFVALSFYSRLIGFIKYSLTLKYYVYLLDSTVCKMLFYSICSILSFLYTASNLQHTKFCLKIIDPTCFETTYYSTTLSVFF